MGYGELEQCKDFDKLKAVFDDDMLGYFEKQLESYLKGSEERPAIVCWWEGAMSTEELLEMHGEAIYRTSKTRVKMISYDTAINQMES